MMSAPRALLFARNALASSSRLGARAPLTLRPITPVPVAPAYRYAFTPAWRFSSSSSSTSTPSTPSSSSSSSTPSTPSSSSSAPTTPSTEEPEHYHSIEAPKPGEPPVPVGKIEPRLAMTFTCTNNGCGHRSTHEFAKKSYEKGVVIVQCPGCKARHLIADHLGWFKEITNDGQHKTVEDLVREQGEKVTKGRVTMDGDIEYAP